MDNNNAPIRSNSDAHASSKEQYPGNPSTFPQSIFPQPSGVPAGVPQQFLQNNQPSKHPDQALSSPLEVNEPNTIVDQLSQQNLDGDVRVSPYDSRRPLLAQQPFAESLPGNAVSSLDSHMTAPESTENPDSMGVFAPAPERNPDKYGPTADNNRKKCSQLVPEFFKDSVHRARQRYQRQGEIERQLQQPSESQLRREQIWSTAGRKEGQYLRFLRTKDKPENYHTIKVIGKGGFGEVKLVQKKADGHVYAMKSLIKAEMVQREQVALVRTERHILAEAESPWVVKLFTTFQDANLLYMLMEFLPGGDLMSMLIKYEIFSEDITRFYMAECILAIEAVHKLGFIHRDIKPDNILLDRGGHIKLTDFGLSTGCNGLYAKDYIQILQGKSSKPGDRSSIITEQINLTVSNRSQINEWRKSRRFLAYSNVGTPDYMAPEIFTGQGYSFSCDWWSLGTIMFECLVGWPPFCADSQHDTQQKIVNWRHALFFPGDIQLGRETENLIRSLICNQEDRLGGSGADQLKAHPFFRGVQFDSLRQIRAPFEPRLTSNVDTAYFPTDEIDQTGNARVLQAQIALQALRDVQPQPEESLDMSLPFVGYTFKRFDNYFR